MNKDIAVLGTGAIGSSVGADLTRAGYNTLLIDQWHAHVEAMKADGLCVSLPTDELRVKVQALHLAEMKNGRQFAPGRQFDIVFLACKSYDTCWLVHFIQPYLKANGVLVSLQNSLNDEWIAPIIGAERDIGCAMELSAEVFTPGRVKRNTDLDHTRFTLGELDGRMTSRLEQVAQILGTVVRTVLTTNIWGAKWTKLLFNCMALSSVTGISFSYEESADPRMLDVSFQLARETVQVALAQGIKLDPIFGLAAEDLMNITDETFKKIRRGHLSNTGGRGRSMNIQDILKGRQTEISYLNGLIAKKGKELNIPTPMNEAVVSVVSQIEQGKIEPGAHNLDLLEKYIEGNKAGRLDRRGISD